MKYGIIKVFKSETIIYAKIDDENVCKMYYDTNGKKTKEKCINVREIKKNRTPYLEVEDYFDDMILNHEYVEIQ